MSSQKFNMHYEVLLLTAALPSQAPITTCWDGGGRMRVGEGGSGGEEQGGSKVGRPEEREGGVGGVLCTMYSVQDARIARYIFKQD